MFASRIIFSSIMLNKMHASASPCLSPFRMWKLSNSSFCILTLAVVPHTLTERYIYFGRICILLTVVVDNVVTYYMMM